MGSDQKARLPETNLAKIAGLTIKDIEDSSGDQLIRILKNLLDKAEKIKELANKKNLNSHEIIEGDQDIIDGMNAYMLDLVYDPICFKIYISELMEFATEIIDFQISESLSIIRKIKSIEYSETGDVLSYKLE